MEWKEVQEKRESQGEGIRWEQEGSGEAGHVVGGGEMLNTRILVQKWLYVGKQISWE